MNALRTLYRFLRFPFCQHRETLTKTDAGTHRMYTECLRCEYQSEGVVITGHDYASTKHFYEPVPPILRMPNGATIEDTLAAMPAFGSAAFIPQDVLKRDCDHGNATHSNIGNCGCIEAQDIRRKLADIPSPLSTHTLGNLAGHATGTRRKPAPEPEYEAVDWGANHTEFSCVPIRRKPKATAKKKTRKISSIKPRKTSRKPSSKRSKTA